MGASLVQVDEVEFPLEDVLVKKEQRAEGLILSGGCDAAIHGKVAEKSGDSGSPMSAG